MRGARAVLGAVALLAAVAAPVAFAAPPVTVAAATPASHPHTMWLELLGKGGLWGVGYEWRSRRLVVGGVGSMYRLTGDTYTTLSPYVGLVAGLGRRTAWFAHAGPQLIDHVIPSPGPEWPGTTRTAFAFETSGGVEYRRRQLALRGYLQLGLGAHVAPGLGLGVGWSL